MRVEQGQKVTDGSGRGSVLQLREEWTQVRHVSRTQGNTREKKDSMGHMSREEAQGDS